jgi:hypothetical protein
MYDDEFENQEIPEHKVKSLAETLKQHLCAQIDAQTNRFITDFRNEQNALKELTNLQSILRHSGNNIAAQENLPFADRVTALIAEARNLRQQLKDQDDLLKAKRHYLPLIQSLVLDAQNRRDQFTVNKINEFVMSGKVLEHG